MSKHEFKMKDTNYDKTINHIRFGFLEDRRNYMVSWCLESVIHGSNIFDGDYDAIYHLGLVKNYDDLFKGKWELLLEHHSSNSHNIEIKQMQFNKNSYR